MRTNLIVMPTTTTTTTTTTWNMPREESSPPQDPHNNNINNDDDDETEEERSVSSTLTVTEAVKPPQQQQQQQQEEQQRHVSFASSLVQIIPSHDNKDTHVDNDSVDARWYSWDELKDLRRTALQQARHMGQADQALQDHNNNNNENRRLSYSKVLQHVYKACVLTTNEDATVDEIFSNTSTPHNLQDQFTAVVAEYFPHRYGLERFIVPSLQQDLERRRRRQWRAVSQRTESSLQFEQQQQQQQQQRCCRASAVQSRPWRLWARVVAHAQAQLAELEYKEDQPQMDDAHMDDDDKVQRSL